MITRTYYSYLLNTNLLSRIDYQLWTLLICTCVLVALVLLLFIFMCCVNRKLSQLIQRVDRALLLEQQPTPQHTNTNGHLVHVNSNRPRHRSGSVSEHMSSSVSLCEQANAPSHAQPPSNSAPPQPQHIALSFPLSKRIPLPPRTQTHQQHGNSMRHRVTQHYQTSASQQQQQQQPLDGRVSRDSVHSHQLRATNMMHRTDTMDRLFADLNNQNPERL